MLVLLLDTNKLNFEQSKFTLHEKCREAELTFIYKKQAFFLLLKLICILTLKCRLLIGAIGTLNTKIKVKNIMFTLLEITNF